VNSHRARKPMRALEQYVTHGRASPALAAEQLALALRNFCGLTASPSTRFPECRCLLFELCRSTT
jgi:hypothetical protein